MNTLFPPDTNPRITRRTWSGRVTPRFTAVIGIRLRLRGIRTRQIDDSAA